MTVNDAEVLAELRELYPAYEKALVENDVEVLTRMFWASEYATRMGVGENLYGVEEIEAFRRGRAGVGLMRVVERLEIVSFGKDFGSVVLEFSRGAVRGRQTQVWVRFGVGWRIVAAHVSLLPLGL